MPAYFEQNAGFICLDTSVFVCRTLNVLYTSFHIVLSIFDSRLKLHDLNTVELNKFNAYILRDRNAAAPNLRQKVFRLDLR